MLVLSRKCDETIHIDNLGVEIVIKVLEIHGNRVSIGIEAPRGEYKILRGEILDAEPNPQ